MRNQTSDLQILQSNAPTLSQQDSVVSKAYLEDMTHILHTARISNVHSIMFVNRLTEIVSFELSEEIEKDVLCLVMSVGQRKNKTYHISYSMLIDLIPRDFVKLKRHRKIKVNEYRLQRHLQLY